MMGGREADGTSMRIAAIDVGSNSIHLVVVETDTLGGQRVLAREKAMVRLAKGGATSGRIGPEAFQAGLDALGAMARTIEDLECDTVMACGTAALRDAASSPLSCATAGQPVVGSVRDHARDHL